MFEEARARSVGLNISLSSPNVLPFYPRADAVYVRQVTYYQSGIGTYNEGGLQNGIGAALDMAGRSNIGRLYTNRGVSMNSLKCRLRLGGEVYIFQRFVFQVLKEPANQLYSRQRTGKSHQRLIPLSHAELPRRR